jgi:hypothetical protein
MKGKPQKGVFGLSSNLAKEIADCLLYEAFQIIEEASEARQEPWPKTKTGFLLSGSPRNEDELREDELRHVAEAAIMEGKNRAFPKEIGPDAIHFGFVAEMVSPKISGKIRYVEEVGWEVWDGQSWVRRPKERGIIGVIYEVMRRKINIWREALESKGLSVRGTGGWLEKLEKNINDPDWLKKVEELLLRVDYFGIEIVSGDA